MSGLLYEAEDWRHILSAIRDGRDEAAMNLLRYRDLRADGQFQVIDEKFYTPLLYQASGNIAANVVAVEGIRVGPWVQVNATVKATAGSVFNGSISLTLPPSLPAVVQSYRPIGTFYVLDHSDDTRYVGIAYSGSGILPGGQLVFGYSNGSTSSQGMGNLNPNAAIAANDEIGYSVQYLVKPEAL